MKALSSTSKVSARASVKVAAVQGKSTRIAFIPSPSKRVVRSRHGLVSCQATAAPEKIQAPAKTEWFALVANADFFFNDVQNEPFAEQLREKVRFFNERNVERDFWIVPNPAWLDNYPEAHKIRRPAVALVSNNKNWTIFMKVRLDRVIRFDLGAVSQKEALKSAAPMPTFVPPQKWTAPYGRYAYGWWTPFLPGNESMKVFGNEKW